MMGWWDLNSREGEELSAQEKEESKRQYSARVKYDAIVTKMVASFEEIVKSEITEGVQIRIVTTERFNAITMLEYLYHNYEFEEIIIAVYRMNLQAVRRLKEFIESPSTKVTILLSEFFEGSKRYEQWCEDLIELSRAKENVSVFFARSHAKVFIAKTRCGKHIVLEGSGNLSGNAKFEQYIFEDNKAVYDFHKNWITDEQKHR